MQKLKKILLDGKKSVFCTDEGFALEPGANDDILKLFTNL